MVRFGLSGLGVISTLRLASLTVANASGRRSSIVSPLANLSLNSSVFWRISASVKDIILGSRELIWFTTGYIFFTILSLDVPNTFVKKLIFISETIYV